MVLVFGVRGGGGRGVIMGHKSWESKPILVAGGKNKEETKRKEKAKRTKN